MKLGELITGLDQLTKYSAATKEGISCHPDDSQAARWCLIGGCHKLGFEDGYHLLRGIVEKNGFTSCTEVVMAAPWPIVKKIIDEFDKRYQAETLKQFYKDALDPKKREI